MSHMEWIVIIGGLTAIAWVNWYFFLAPAVAGKREQNTKSKRSSSTQ